MIDPAIGPKRRPANECLGAGKFRKRTELDGSSEEEVIGLSLFLTEEENKFEVLASLPMASNIVIVVSNDRCLLVEAVVEWSR